MDSPWQLNSDVDENDRWRLDCLAVLAMALAAATVIGQWRVPAPYGRHDPKDGKWGPRVNQIIGHILNDGLWGVSWFIYLLYRSTWYHQFGLVNSILVMLWLSHFVYRGFFHPFFMRYSSPTVALGIPITGVTLGFFSYFLVAFLSAVTYSDVYLWDLRFQSGVAVFIIGCLINRFSDWTLRSMRAKSGTSKYKIPKGGLFDFVSCPNYFGELIQWLGWALATWSWVGFAYFCFAAATFIPRARHNHRWYITKFKDYPRQRKSIIPFLF